MNLYNLLDLGKRGNYEDMLQLTRATRLHLMCDKMSWTIDELQCDARITPALIGKLAKGQVISTHCITSVFRDGPKYFTMTGRQFESLENTDLTLPIANYEQPHDTMCFPIPEDYARDRCIDLFEKVRVPKYAIVKRLPEMILFTVIYEKDFIWATAIIPTSPEATFENTILTIAISDRIEAPIKDLEVLQNIIRAVLNGCLIFDSVKTTQVQASAPGKKPKKTDAIYYSFNRSVRLHSGSGDGEGDPKGSGSHVTPHWRRGYWRMQPCGPNGSQRKRIRIAPVLVRKDLYGGDLKDARSEYKQ